MRSIGLSDQWPRGASVSSARKMSECEISQPGEHGGLSQDTGQNWSAALSELKM